MGKRAATPATTKAAAKKAKGEVKLDPAFASVCDAVMEAEQLPDRVRDMLVEMMPFSLKFASDERHELQNMAVDMVEQTLIATKAAQDAAVANEDGALARLKASESTLGVAVTSGEAALAAQKDTVEAKKLVESTAMGASQASEKKLQEESSAKSLAVEKLGHMQTEKVAIESAFAEHFKPMEDGEASAKAHLKKLEPFLKKIEIESTLLTALPSTCAKLKEKRGTFDNLVLVELDKAFKLKIAALGDAIAAEGPAAVQRDASLQAAENDHAAKTAALTGAEKEARASEQELAARETSLTNAKQAVDDFGPQVEEVTGRLSSAQLALAEFEAGPLTNFTSFKTRVAALPEEPAADEASEPQAAAADEEPQAAAADEEPAAAA